MKVLLYALDLVAVRPLLLRLTTPASSVRLVGSHVNDSKYDTSLAFHIFRRRRS